MRWQHYESLKLSNVKNKDEYLVQILHKDGVCSYEMRTGSDLIFLLNNENRRQYKEEIENPRMLLKDIHVCRITKVGAK